MAVDTFWLSIILEGFGMGTASVLIECGSVTVAANIGYFHDSGGLCTVNSVTIGTARNFEVMVSD